MGDILFTLTEYSYQVSDCPSPGHSLPFIP
jgi:hypothetical protein